MVRAQVVFSCGTERLGVRRAMGRPPLLDQGLVGLVLLLLESGTSDVDGQGSGPSFQFRNHPWPAEPFWQAAASALRSTGTGTSWSPHQHAEGLF
jgi:hypothetical protein